MILLCSKDGDFLTEWKTELGLNDSACFSNIAEVSSSGRFVEDDILIFDLNSADSDEIININCRVIALCSVPMYEEAVRLLKQGVKAYGNRRMLSANLKQAIEIVQSGQVWLPPSILNSIITSIPASSSGDNGIIDGLSERENEVAQYIGEGKSNKEISEAMNITVRTVKAHITSIFNKTDCRDRIELALRIKKKS
jgi:DNA-binding NarL/FixJ family response regulator